MTAPPRRQQYDAAFYERIRKGSQDSAMVVVPKVIDDLYFSHMAGGYPRSYPRSVLDVGCGEGTWALEFAKFDNGSGRAIEVRGLDGGSITNSPLGDRLIKWDLLQRFPAIGFTEDQMTLVGENWKVDLVVCLEVAEHLPEVRAEGFVADLCEAGQAVVFSAAIPGQGGTGHINCQWPAYWFELFRQQGYFLDYSFRWKIWGDRRVEPWYRNNMAIAMPWWSDSHGATFEPHAVIHPDMWIDWKSAYTGPRST